MQVSIGRLATILVALLIVVTMVTTAVGLYVLHGHYRSLEERHTAEANDTVRNAALAIRNQVRFHQGMLRLVTLNPEVFNLLEFGVADEIVNWSQTLGRLLPGTLGTALASAEGTVIGDPLSQRIGAACQADLRHFSAGRRIEYPPLHTDVAGLEHFDLLAHIDAPDGTRSGTLFVSFRLDILSDLLASLVAPGDRLLLLDSGGSTRLAVGETPPSEALGDYRSAVPETSWEVVLHRPLPQRTAFITELLIADAIILAAAAIVVTTLVRIAHGRFAADMRRVHEALRDVLAGRYRPSGQPTAIREFGILLKDTEDLALKIQQQSEDLRQQSLSDPLTGVFNRRYFDLMLNHLHAQSRRQPPAFLVVIDLDGFKQVNDLLGHPAGDRVLRDCAAFLQGQVRASDIVTRLGGDEFALILNRMDPGSMGDWLEHLCGAYDRRDQPDGAPRCHLSVGAAPVDSAFYGSPHAVFEAADSAMYRAKQAADAGRSRYLLAANLEALTAAQAGH